MKKKIPQIDAFELGIKYALYRHKSTYDDVEHHLKQFHENHKVLTKLIEAGFCKPEVMEEVNVKWGESVRIKKSQLPKLRSAVGSVKESAKSLECAKKRLIKVTLKLEDYPNSNVVVEYLRPYPKEEEALCPCKIEMVEIESAVDARPARPARVVPQLVCKTDN